jgi:hypothetical protein
MRRVSRAGRRIARPVGPLSADDALLVQRVLGHVLESQVRGQLPPLSWHSGLAEEERHAVRREWPRSSELWEELDERRASMARIADDSNLMLPLRDLLLAHRSSVDPVLTVLANALACACLGSRHLWQDLAATGRDEVSHLLALGFPALHDSNLRNLRWKRHLFLVLGAQLGTEDLRPPKCDGCDNYDACFAPSGPAAMTTWPLALTPRS